MSEIEQIILTSIFTIIGGVAIYVAGQIISKFFIEPIHRQKEIIGEINDALIFYANIYCNPGFPTKKKMGEALYRFRQLSTLLQSKTFLIPWYNWFTETGLVLNLVSIEEVSKELIGLSNSVYETSSEGLEKSVGVLNSERADKIRKLLKLKLIN